MFTSLLARIAQKLDALEIPYMVIGGQAVLLYGEPRLTADIDITLGATADQLGIVLKAMQAIDLRPLVDPEPFVRETMVLPCLDSESRIRVDLIFSFSPYERQAIAHARARYRSRASPCGSPPLKTSSFTRSSPGGRAIWKMCAPC